MAASKNKALNALPRFIWGEAVSEAGFEPQDFLIHSRYPRFICRVHEGDDVDTEPGEFTSEIGLHPHTQEPIYCTNADVNFMDFVWLDKGGMPPPKAVKEACDAAILNYMMRDDEYGINNDD